MNDIDYFLCTISTK